MICIISLVVFSILGIFSLNYRKLAIEAFDCVFRRITLRKCDSGLDQRVKGQIVGKLYRLNKVLGKFVYRYFEIFSWVLVILMFVSAYYTGLGTYNYLMYGNCNGPDSNEFCIFDPLNSGAQYSECGDAPVFTGTFQAPVVKETDHFIGPENADVVVVQFGCYSCEFTQKSQDSYNEIMDDYKDRVKFVNLHFPIEKHEGAFIAAHATECAAKQNPNKFWEYHRTLFRVRDFSINSLKNIAEGLELDENELETCLFTPEIHALVEENFQRGIESGVKGTPTFFVNEQSYTGNVKYNKLRDMIEEELAKFE